MRRPEHTRSAIYTGSIRHRRYAVREQEFTHGIALAYIDLDELPGLLGGRLAGGRPGLVRFRRADYLGDPGRPLAEAVRAAVAEHGPPGAEPLPDGPVRLLTQLRTFGHCFNPVSFYYCFDRDERLRALVAEVTNTPWGERRTYVLREQGAGGVLAGLAKLEQGYAARIVGDGTWKRWRGAAVAGDPWRRRNRVGHWLADQPVGAARTARAGVQATLASSSQ